jgi:hypothetical protein
MAHFRGTNSDIHGPTVTNDTWKIKFCLTKALGKARIIYRCNWRELRV